ncbi:hypothetical protein [Streptomyces sp. NPDC093984]|uniref:hypothetical protein n=1 Tax=Streptomyces sp. NPDC093984 TaxID=3366052 RepID=UPI003803E190
MSKAAGLDARWVHPPGKADHQPGEVLMEIHQQERLRGTALPGGLTMTPGWTLQMRLSELERYPLELLRPGSWVAGIEHVLAARQAGQPWPPTGNGVVAKLLSKPPSDVRKRPRSPRRRGSSGQR